MLKAYSTTSTTTKLTITHSTPGLTVVLNLLASDEEVGVKSVTKPDQVIVKIVNSQTRFQCPY